MNRAMDGCFKTIHIPRMCDASHVLAAAFRHHGIPSEVLPETTPESVALGQELCGGRECLPCFATVGDFIHHARSRKCDRHHAALLMLGSSGPCRLGQYAVLARRLLDEHRLEEVDILSPSSIDSYKSFGPGSGRVRWLCWQGVVATDLLQQLVLGHRPYEAIAGSTDAIHAEGLRQITTAVESGGGARLVRVMEGIASRFESLAIDRTQARPRIGIVGEIYVRQNAFANQGLARQVEQAGGEVALATNMEWMYYTNLDMAQRSHRTGNWVAALQARILDLGQRFAEHRITRPVRHLLRFRRESPALELQRAAAPYLTPVVGCDTEALLTLGKAVTFAREGFSGILNVMPFSCMPGVIAAGIAPRIRADFDNIPWLDVSYDSLGGTNLRTRLEPFLHQARQFQLRTRPRPPEPLRAAEGPPVGEAPGAPPGRVPQAPARAPRPGRV